MALTWKQVKRSVTDVLPVVMTGRRMRVLEQRLQTVQHLSMRSEHFGFGSSATYIGDNRILIRIVAGTHLFMMYLHADDKLITPSLVVNGRYEPEVTDYLVGALQPDSHCLDVGANLGYFSCLMAKYCTRGNVIGLEPNPPVHATAVDNILVNALSDRAQILNVAASDWPGELTLYHRIGRAGNTSMAACGEDFTRAFQEPPEQAFTVPTMRIDDLLDRMSGRVDFMKIDVEGAEPLALAGARETIAANPQLRIVMEWAPSQIRHAGFDVGDFVRTLGAIGLTFHLLADRPEAISAETLMDHVYLPGVLLQRVT